MHFLLPYLQDLLLESRNLDMIRPAYSAKLVISSSNKSVPINIPFKCTPSIFFSSLLIVRGLELLFFGPQ